MRWSRLVLVVALMGMADTVYSQAPQMAFRIGFNDKSGSPPIADASTFLSERALGRRQKQAIPVEETDRPVTRTYIDSVLTLTGGRLHVISRWFNQCVILVEDSTGIHNLEDLTFVRTVQLVAYYHSGLHQTFPDSLSQRKSSLELIEEEPFTIFRKTEEADSSIYGASFIQTSMVNGHALHELGYRGDGMLIAVMDAGYENVDAHRGFGHLFARGLIKDTYDFVLNDSYVYHHDLHGTGVLAPIGGDVSGEYLGAAPDAMYALYRTEDNYSEQLIEIDNLIAGIERADSIGADIINVSLGYNEFDFPNGAYIDPSEMDGHSTISAKAVNYAAQKGILFVTTAGNEGYSGLLTPGEADSALTVGAVNIQRDPAGFSSWGPNAAGRVKPEVTVLGDPAIVFSSTGISAGGGTSFAAPQVAGWAACLWQARPDITASELKDAIVRSAHLYPSSDRQMGYGIPDFKIAGVLLKVIDTVQTPASFDLVAVWPTFFRKGETVRIIIDPPNPLLMDFTLFDLNGRILWQQEQFFQGGRQYYELTFPPMSSGIYLLRATGGGQKKTVRMIHF